MGNAYSDVKESDSELESDSDEEVVKRTPEDSDWTFALRKKIDHIERMVISGSEFSSGLEENHQFIQYENGDTYEGEWYNDLFHGLIELKLIKINKCIKTYIIKEKEI